LPLAGNDAGVTSSHKPLSLEPAPLEATNAVDVHLNTHTTGSYYDRAG
jgi:hypothetical protein